MMKYISNLYKFYTLLVITGIIGFSFGLSAQPMPYFEKMGETFILPPSNTPMCHASTLVELSNGDILSAWFEGSYEGAKDVSIHSSIFHNNQWSVPKPLVVGLDYINSGHDTMACWNPVLFKAPDNTVFLYYKVGKSPREWWGACITSTDDGKTWSSPTQLSLQLGPVKNKPIITTAGTWLFPTSSETMDDWNVFIERSSDNGTTWKTIPIDTSISAKVIQPTLLQYPDSSIHALCRSNQNCIMESVSNDDGKTWSHLAKTTILNPNSGIDAITKKNGVTFLVYNPMESGKEWVAGRNQLMIAISFDGLEWYDIYRLEDAKEGEFSYPAIIEGSDGLIHITYTYNRKNIKHLIFKSNF
jgi:predicted neuraminidase